MKDIKAMDTLKEFLELKSPMPFHPLAFFAEAVAMSRQEKTGVSIEEMGKCFRYQFDEAELSSLISELNKGKL